MLDLPLPLVRDVVLIGGGHAHALFLRKWGMEPVAGVRLTLVDPGATAPYTGMLPGFVAGHYRREELDIDLVRLARFAGARLILGRVSAIDRESQRVSVDGRPPIPYDVASIDIGITSEISEIIGFSDFAIPAKPLGRFANQWSAFRQAGGGAIAVVGGGVGGVELALAMRHALRSKPTSHPVSILEKDRILSGLGRRARNKLLVELQKSGIDILEGVEIAEVGSEAVTLSDGREVPSSLTVGAAGARPYQWLEDTGLHLTDGFITVDRQLRSITDKRIFAAGDCAHLSHAPRPKAGVYAVRAAPVLLHNMRADVTGKARRAFSPQKGYLKLISLGRKSAVAERSGFSVSGDWAWVWKDRIDRAFMDKLDHLPRMGTQKLPGPTATGLRSALGSKPLCGGCGAKVGSEVIETVVSSAVIHRPDIEEGPGDDGAILKIGEKRQILTVDVLRALWSDPYVMAKLAAFHALGDAWAMGAAPQAALAQITLPRMTADMQSDWLSEIMAAARTVFADEGAEIVGGHTTLGAELQLGFTVTGLDPRVRNLGGGRAGDALLLTRPIGSGVLFAAEMERRARGEDIAALLTCLTTSQGNAARHLAPLVNAMTDVTGFGFAGHLSRLARASGCGAYVKLDDVPAFDGAERLAAEGLRSSIWSANRDSVHVDAPESAKADLLYDPQTCGGLLAALPGDRAKTALATMISLGHEAAIVGTLTKDLPRGAIKAR